MRDGQNDKASRRRMRLAVMRRATRRIFAAALVDGGDFKFALPARPVEAYSAGNLFPVFRVKLFIFRLDRHFIFFRGGYMPGLSIECPSLARLSASSGRSRIYTNRARLGLLFYMHVCSFGKSPRPGRVNRLRGPWGASSSIAADAFPSASWRDQGSGYTLTGLYPT